MEIEGGYPSLDVVALERFALHSNDACRIGDLAFRFAQLCPPQFGDQDVFSRCRVNVYTGNGNDRAARETGGIECGVLPQDEIDFPMSGVVNYVELGPANHRIASVRLAHPKLRRWKVLQKTRQFLRLRRCNDDVDIVRGARDAMRGTCERTGDEVCNTLRIERRSEFLERSFGAQ